MGGYSVFEFLVEKLASRARIGAGCMAAAAMVAAMSFAAPAAAVETVQVYSATLTDMQFGQTDDPTLAMLTPQRGYFGMAPLIVDAHDDTTGQNFTVLGFCIDFYTDMHEDVGAGQNMVNYAYYKGQLADSPLVTPGTELKIARLINFGTDLWVYHNHTPYVQARLAAIQGAIWQIMTGKTFSFIDGIGSSLGSNDHLIQEFANLQGVPNQVSSSQVRALFSHDGQSQAIAYSLRTAVPEPGVWSLMIVGFFGAGSLLRKSRRRVSTAG